MPLGKEIGAFSLQSVTHTVTPLADGEIEIQVNLEGTQSGEISGPVVGTLTVGGRMGAKTGNYTWCGFAFPDGADPISATGDGVWTETGRATWRFVGTNRLSDGSLMAVEADGDFAKRTLSLAGDASDGY